MKNISQVYEETKALIQDTVHKFFIKYKGDYQELISIANEEFVLAFHSFNPDKSKISTWIRNKIWWRLLNHMRQKIQTEKNTKQVKLNRIPYSETKPILETLEELSKDAKIVVSIVLYPPEQEWDNRPKMLRKQLKDFLKGIGWTTKRITESFGEISNILRN